MSSTRYDLEGGKSPYSDANLLYITSARFGEDWHSTPHTHACVELFYCVRGTGQFYIAGKYLNVGRDDLVIINPAVEHTEVGMSNEPLEYIVLGIDGIEFNFANESDLPYLTHNFREKQSEIALQLKMMLQENESQSDWYEALCKNLLEVLLIRIFRYLECEVLPSDKHSNKDCTQAKHYIDAHFSENITLDFLAELTHLNKYYLVHVFNREYSMSPINYLISRRIRESKYLLVNTNHSLSQISDILGFTSPSHFSQSFKRLEDMTPREYRKLHKAVENL